MYNMTANNTFVSSYLDWTKLIRCYLYESFCCQPNVLIVTPVSHHLPVTIHLGPCKQTKATCQNLD